MKDLKFMKNQKQFFLIILIVSIGMLAGKGNYSFVAGYMTLVFCIFATTTINYDELDNGYAFLFTLPCSRKEYVGEKYLLGIMTGLVSGCLAVALSAAAMYVRKESGGFVELLSSAAIILAVGWILMSIMIPIQIKFGSEKSRIVLLVISAVCVAAGYFGKNILAYFKIDLTGLFTAVESLNMWTLSAVILCFALLILFLSFLLSIKAVMKKEL